MLKILQYLTDIRKSILKNQMLKLDKTCPKKQKVIANYIMYRTKKTSKSENSTSITKKHLFLQETVKLNHTKEYSRKKNLIQQSTLQLCKSNKILLTSVTTPAGLVASHELGGLSVCVVESSTVPVPDRAFKFSMKPLKI